MVMNIGPGAGTLVHEVVHPYMEANFPDVPVVVQRRPRLAVRAAEREEGPHRRPAELAAAQPQEARSTRRPLPRDDHAARHHARRVLQRRVRRLCLRALPAPVPPGAGQADRVLREVRRRQEGPRPARPRSRPCSARSSIRSSRSGASGRSPSRATTGDRLGATGVPVVRAQVSSAPYAISAATSAYGRDRAVAAQGMARHDRRHPHDDRELRRPPDAVGARAVGDQGARHRQRSLRLARVGVRVRVPVRDAVRRLVDRPRRCPPRPASLRCSRGRPSPRSMRSYPGSASCSCSASRSASPRVPASPARRRRCSGSCPPADRERGFGVLFTGSSFGAMLDRAARLADLPPRRLADRVPRSPLPSACSGSRCGSG